MKTSKLKWISTTGGPLILMAKTSLAAWEGTGMEKFETWSDYDRACEVEDYLDVINVGDEKALVLGDLPSHTASVVVDSSTVLFIRWIWANDENQVVDAINEFSIEQQDWANTDLEIRFSMGDIVLFDSSYTDESVEETLEMTIEPGAYTPRTLSYEPSPAINLFLILLQKRAG
jgi:hypothetical protein